jgi:hypothetical protein
LYPIDPSGRTVILNAFGSDDCVVEVAVAGLRVVLVNGAADVSGVFVELAEQPINRAKVRIEITKMKMSFLLVLPFIILDLLA